jgi:iron complex transport system ATP-binding protein
VTVNITINNEFIEASTAIKVENLTVQYDGVPIIEQLNLQIKKGHITALIGPNGCGKSTLLKTICRLIKPKVGGVYLEGDINVHSQSSKEIAKKLALLGQASQAPEGIDVKTLVGYGRAPYLNHFGILKEEDKLQVTKAMAQTGISELANCALGSLSGGQLQRVWIALVLAQDTDILLLDEPTTYLDIAHQYDLLSLLTQLNKQGKTIVIVMHDLNQACRFAHELIVMKSGCVVSQGLPKQVFTEKMLKEVFDFEALIIEDPESNSPLSIAKQCY